MEKRSLSDLEIEAVSSELSDDILRDLKTPVSQRRGFRHNPYVVTIPRYYYRFVGIKDNEENYYENLFRFDRELSRFGELYKRFGQGFDKNISLALQNKLLDIWARLTPGSELDTGRLIELLEQYSLLPQLSNIVLKDQIKNNFKGLIDYYLKVNQEIKPENLKLIVNYTVYWMNLYMESLLEGFDYSAVNPKIIFYGEILLEECFFLNLLSTVGCDILYFNPRRAGEFVLADKFNTFSREILYGIRRDIKAFPEEIKERVKTTAYTAKEELNKTLFSEDSSFYRPWQFSDYSIKAVTLKTTYEEVNIWTKEKAMIRDGWKIENKTVYIPNIFAKVSGTHADIDRYWKEMNQVIDQKQTMFIYKKLPMIEVVPLEYGKLEQVYPNKPYADFDVEKLLRAPWWKYKDLRTGLQRSMAEKLRHMCLHPVVMNNEVSSERDFQTDIFSVLMNLDVKFQQLLQGFDYPDGVPKIIIYNNEQNGNLSYEDCIMLAFMNMMGVDIIIYNPSGYNDIENYVYPDTYDLHRLEEVTFNLPFKRYVEKKGFFRSIFGK